MILLGTEGLNSYSSNSMHYQVIDCDCFCTGHAKVMVSLLQDTQEKDQRLTMLQLVDKMKNKKELGLSYGIYFQ